MREYSEVYVAFDVSKTKHAVAIADGGRSGEVRFFGEVSSSRRQWSGCFASWPVATASCISAMRMGSFRRAGFGSEKLNGSWGATVQRRIKPEDRHALHRY